jgi:CRISPR-associated protein Csm3
MHKTRYNALRLTLEIRPRGPLLIKAGGLSADPTLPDMQFVRTYHPEKGETVYIPGSSLKGVVRGFTEKVLRTLNRTNSWRWACPTFPDERESCAKRLEKGEEQCGRLPSILWRVPDLRPYSPQGPGRVHRLLAGITEIKTEIRYGVAISRLSHAVAQGPFEMEIAVDGTFKGYLLLENYELWQLGLLALALESMNQGLVKVGFGKNRGFGEVDGNCNGGSGGRSRPPE